MKNTKNTIIFKAINIKCLRHCLLKSLSHRVIAKVEIEFRKPPALWQDHERSGCDEFCFPISYPRWPYLARSEFPLQHKHISFWRILAFATSIVTYVSRSRPKWEEGNRWRRKWRKISTYTKTDWSNDSKNTLKYHSTDVAKKSGHFYYTDYY